KDATVRLTSKAFGPRVYDVKLAKGVTTAADVEVTWAVGNPDNALKDVPVVVEAPEGWRVDPEKGKGSFNIKVKAPVAKAVLPCGLPAEDPAAAPAGQNVNLASQAEVAKSDPTPCNLVRLYVVEQHGTEDDPKPPERGTKGAF